MTTSSPVVRDLGLTDYLPVCEAMRLFTQIRTPLTPDEIWFVEHPAVYTAGRNTVRRPDHIGTVPLISVERGGNITYHAPGQMVVYPLLNLRRRGLFVKSFVHLLLQSLIETLSAYNIAAFTHPHAPGVYVHLNGGIGEFKGLAKIASIGIRISRGCSYHGIALNVDMDLSGFRRIAPCGYSGLRMTDMASLLGTRVNLHAVKADYRLNLLKALSIASNVNHHD